MTLSFVFTFVIAVFVASTSSAPVTSPDLLPVHNITRLPNLKFENLAVRSNGQLLTTISAPVAQVYQIDPLAIRPPVPVHAFDKVQHAAGVCELQRDVFYVATGNFTITEPTIHYPSTLAVYSVNMTMFSAWPNGSIRHPATVQKVAALPQAALLNGMTPAGPQTSSLLIADSFAGVIWHLDLKTGLSSVALNDSTTSGPGRTGSSATGVNGVKIFNGSLYYTNTGASALYRVPLNSTGFVPAGQRPVTIASNLSCDDFALDAKENAYVAGPASIITKISPDGAREIIAGAFNSSSSPLHGPTSVQLGRGPSDWMSLYVTTNGGVLTEVVGSEGVSRIDLF